MTDGSPSFSEPPLLAMLGGTSTRLLSIHRNQVHRSPWPAFEEFDVDAYDKAIRRRAAVQWAGRARAEHGSVHQFAQLLHALSEARAPLPIAGALARLITDEVRHAELCVRAAEVIDPEALEENRGGTIGRWPSPKAPWPPAPAPQPRDEERAILRWAADVTLTACCLGEALSRPMLEAIAVVSTDPLPEAIAAQILRDEHLHATFGFETLRWLWPRIGEDGTRWLQEEQLPRRLAGFERSTACGITAGDLQGQTVVIEPPGADDPPNLGVLSDEQYAAIFFSTLEGEVFPQLRDIGLDPDRAWAARPAP